MSNYADKIIDLLTPKVGRLMAKSALNVQCKKAGITSDRINSSNLHTIADSLHGPLKIFAGEDFAGEMVMDIKKL